MESPSRPRAWYFFSDDLPDGEILMPIKSKHGLAFAVRPNAGMEQEMLDQLNKTAEFVLGVGLAHLDTADGEPPERKE
ncbi:hypothetical protein AB0911_30540 [Streptomyces nigra]|uniref:hypothetical protein n=1 Tax=Streptomyces nigra TaxID=1827580 RepID=UPI0034517406